MQMQSTLGNAASGTGLVYSTQSNTYSAGTTQDCGACTAEIMPKAAGANPTIPAVMPSIRRATHLNGERTAPIAKQQLSTKPRPLPQLQRFDDILNSTINSPAQITADQNNYNPGTKVVWRISTDAEQDFHRLHRRRELSFRIADKRRRFQPYFGPSTTAFDYNKSYHQSEREQISPSHPTILALDLRYDCNWQGRWRTMSSTRHGGRDRYPGERIQSRQGH